MSQPLSQLQSISLVTEYQRYTIHPAADIFPLLDEASLADLAKDIEQNGLQEPIKRLDGQILDGRNRLRACLLAGVEPQFEDVSPDDPLQYVISLNLHRRHLNESQRAWIANNLHDLQICMTQYDVAKAMNVSVRSVANAASVKQSAVPELCEAIQRGELPVSTAVRIAKLEEEDQRKIVPLPKKERLKALRKLSQPEQTVERTVTVTIEFSEDEIRLIDKYRRKSHEAQDRPSFIRETVLGTCETMRDWENFKDPRRFVKPRYRAKDLVPGKRGISRMEEDEAREEDAMADRRFHGVKV